MHQDILSKQQRCLEKVMQLDHESIAQGIQGKKIAPHLLSSLCWKALSDHNSLSQAQLLILELQELVKLREAEIELLKRDCKCSH